MEDEVQATRSAGGGKGGRARADDRVRDRATRHDQVEPQNAKTVAVGAHEDVKVSVGDVVVLRKYSGTEVKLDGEDHRIADAEDILGVIKG